MAAMAATAMRAAIRPYSMAVAPLLLRISFRNLVMLVPFEFDRQQMPPKGKQRVSQANRSLRSDEEMSPDGIFRTRTAPGGPVCDYQNRHAGGMAVFGNGAAGED